MITVIVVEPHDGKHPGDTYEVSDIQARELRELGLVKMHAQPVANKMLSGPKENKSFPPSPAAGVVVTQSALPAARVSHAQTARTSARGRKQAPRRGK